MKNAIIISIAILVTGIIFAFIIAPKPTTEQIEAQKNAQIEKDNAAQQRIIELRELQIKENAAKSDAQKQAEIIGGSVNNAIGAYVGIQALKIFLSN